MQSWKVSDTGTRFLALRYFSPLVLALCFLHVGAALAQGTGEEETQALAAAAQNPVAAMYSLPFQNNTYFGAGPNHDKTANVLNIQPVLPFSYGDWNIISRTIAPLIYVPSVKTGFGSNLGEDTTEASAGPRAFPVPRTKRPFWFSESGPC